MRLRTLSLRNFRQHADTRVEFRDGVTGIIGPNGAGKTTILEAIAWAVYGSGAARGTNDSIRFLRAPGRSKVEVELVFELGAHELRVYRTLSSAEVYLDGATTPVAVGVGPATEYLARRLGMSRVEFFNTYFTGQKELQFLGQMGAAERARFLAQVLGYERLRLVQERVRRHAKELRQRAEGLRTGLPEPDTIARELREAAERRQAAAQQARDAADAARQAVAAFAQLEPEWLAAQRDRDRDRELAHAVELAAREQDSALRDVGRLDGEIRRATSAAAELDALRPTLEELGAVAAECDRLAALAASAARRQALDESAADKRQELAELRRRLERLSQAPPALERFNAELDAARAAFEAAETGVATQSELWVEQKQETQTKLQHYRDRAAELKEQLRQLREAGPDGTCPSCTRPLGKEFERVVGSLNDEWERLVQDGKWLAQRAEQLRAKPPELVEAESARAEAKTHLEEAGHKHGQCERAVQELWTVAEDLKSRESALASLEAELADLAADYDAERHRAAKARLDVLRVVEKKAAALEPLAGAVQRLAAERTERAAAAAAAAARREELAVERAALGFAETAFHDVRTRHEAAANERRRTEVEAGTAAERLVSAETALATARKAEQAFRERLAALTAVELDQKHHAELDQALTRLRSELNARVRPELSELASAFLTDITDGRYTALELDESYELLVLDEGEEKPVISGGEEDVANLVLRLAISQMIAERAGQPLSVLILDEVFASLDIERRDSVIQLLHKLTNRFQQVILITHVETIREGLDQVLRVTYDERSGASLVREEALTGVAEEVEVGV
jgi:DNA repair protein SbcC/Rad50